MERGPYEWVLPQDIWKKRDEPDKEPPRGGREELERKRESTEWVRLHTDLPHRTQAIEGPHCETHVCRGYRVYFLGKKRCTTWLRVAKDMHPPRA